MNASPFPSTASAAVTSPSPDAMEVLNSECFCISLNIAVLRQALESEIGQPGLFDLIQQRCPYLFATRPVFLSHQHVAEQVRDWGADVIVLGTHGRGGVGRMLMGSDAEQIVRTATATVPVLLVRGTPPELDHATSTGPSRARTETL